MLNSVCVSWVKGKGEWGWEVRMLGLGGEDVRVWEVKLFGFGSEGNGDSFSDTEWRRTLIPFKWRSTLIPFKWRRTLISPHRNGADLSFLPTEVAQNSHFSPTDPSPVISDFVAKKTCLAI